MTASHGLGTYGNGVGTVTPLDHKLANSGLVIRNADGTVHAGVFWAGSPTIVSGKPGMSYDVAAFSAALSRSAASGTVLLANDGVVNVATTAAPGANSRYDVVYVWQREFSLDGTDSNPVIGVVQGTAAASPTVPSLAAFPGAIALAKILVPAGVTATNTGTTITQTAPFTAAAGGLVIFRNATERDAAVLVQGTKALLLSDATEWVSDGTVWKSKGGAGLVPMIPTSVSAAAGSATVGPGGVVSVVSASSILLNGIFTSSYDNYLIKFDFPTITWQNMNLRLAAAGSTVSSATYDNTQSVGGATDTSTSGDTDVIISTSGAASVRASGTVEIFGPALAENTTFEFRTQKVSSGNGMTRTSGSAQQRTASAFDGLQFVPTSALLSTGTIRVYGWNNN